ncbi:CsbD family protein [Methylobacterium durans]|uniref:CsbD family protein n=1 Tax=Methylobacterium durans TaxID=2202825 RepID=A0A2U8WDU6_9HYPH|nr:CsbD family protein [Methylobacterium durans]AWN43620.1 CsbD family protein [Methylobacterium durans]MEA1832615.1 CsbD family protein [Methylobacterium durans]
MAVDKDQEVDPDRTEGAAKNLGGKVKEGAGRLVGDEKLKNEGKLDQVKGKVQNAVGGIKDALKGK